MLFHVFWHQILYALFTQTFWLSELFLHRDNLDYVLVDGISPLSFLFFYVLFGLFWAILNILHFLFELSDCFLFGGRHVIWFASILLIYLGLRINWNRRHPWPRRHWWRNRGTRRLHHSIRWDPLRSSLPFDLFLFKSRWEFDSFIN